MKSINELVSQAKEGAVRHSLKCEKLIAENCLKDALEYAIEQGINPPTCSLTAVSTNADKMRLEAGRKLSESNWWSRRLETQAARKFEEQQRKDGNIDNIVSDELLTYYRANK
jgi:hypothetical protein